MPNEMTEHRHQIRKDQILAEHKRLLLQLVKRYEEKGQGIAVSRHEIVGLISEEWQELLDALRSNDEDDFYDELIDIAVACLHGMISINTTKMDW